MKGKFIGEFKGISEELGQAYSEDLSRAPSYLTHFTSRLSSSLSYALSPTSLPNGEISLLTKPWPSGLDHRSGQIILRHEHRYQFS